MKRKTRGSYTPRRGMDPEKIHQALAELNRKNRNQGATAREIAERSGVALRKVKKEMQWGKQGNNGQVIVRRGEGDEALYWHTHRYLPDAED